MNSSSSIFQDVPTSERRSAFLKKRHLAAVLFRIAQVLGRRHAILGSLVKQLNGILTGADIAWEAQIGEGLILYHPTGVVIGRASILGKNCIVESDVVLGGRATGEDGRPVLGDRVFLGAGCRLLGGISVGSDVTVGANAVVLVDCPDGSTAVGVPARVVEAKR